MKTNLTNTKKQQKCPNCNGDGIYSDFDEDRHLQTVDCTLCNGTGIRDGE